MKASKPLLITQSILMYLAHLPFYILLILLRVVPVGEMDNVLGILFLIGFILSILILPITIVNLIVGFVSVIKGDHSPLKITMIIKLILIPWYMLNFLICACVIGIMANPWLFMAAPIVAFFMILFTFMFMISTSIYDITYMINKLVKKEVKVSASIIILLILLLFFTLDIISSIILYFRFKKAL